MNAETDGLDVHGDIEMTCGSCGQDHEGRYCHPWYVAASPLLVMAVLAWVLWGLFVALGWF